MNPINLFKYLEKEKGRQIPLKVKLIHDLPLTPEDLNINGDLLIMGRNNNITSLPQGLHVKGDLSVYNSNISSLPPDLKVEGNLWIRLSPMFYDNSDKEIRAMLKTGYIKGRIIR